MGNIEVAQSSYSFSGNSLFLEGLPFTIEKTNSYFITDGLYLYPYFTLPPLKSDPVRPMGLPTTKKIFLPGDEIARIAGQCVAYVKYYTGLSYTGNAIEWKKYIGSDIPQIGSVVVIDVNRTGHLGVVMSIGKKTIIVRSRNWRGLWIVSDDEFNINDPRILGYVKVE